MWTEAGERYAAAVEKQKLKAAVVARLYALADGAEPCVNERGNNPSWGICEDIGRALGGFPARVMVENVCYHEFGTPEGEFAFDPTDWSGPRRTLAGLLAAYIETEL